MMNLITFYADGTVELNDAELRHEGWRYHTCPITLHVTDVYECTGLGWYNNITPEQHTEYEGLMFGDDECIDISGHWYDDDTDFYQYFLCDGKLYQAWYRTCDTNGDFIPLDEIDYEHPAFLELVDSNPLLDNTTPDRRWIPLPQSPDDSICL